MKTLGKNTHRSHVGWSISPAAVRQSDVNFSAHTRRGLWVGCARTRWPNGSIVAVHSQELKPFIMLDLYNAWVGVLLYSTAHI